MSKQTTQQKYLPEFIYGSIDGLVTTFAIVTGVMGAALSPSVILVLGFVLISCGGNEKKTKENFSYQRPPSSKVESNPEHEK